MPMAPCTAPSPPLGPLWLLCQRTAAPAFLQGGDVIPADCTLLGPGDPLKVRQRRLLDAHS